MKNTKLIVFVSALLCAVMALSSCTGSAALPNNDVLANDPIHENVIVPTESESDGTGEVPTIDTVTASGKLAIWQKYLKFNKIDIDPVSAEKTVVLDTQNYSIEWQNNYGVVVLRTSDYENNTEDEVPTRTYTYSYNVYNIYGTSSAILVGDNKYKMDLNTRDIIWMEKQTVLNEVIDMDFYGLFCAEYTTYKPVLEELPEGSTETPKILKYVVEKTYYEFYLKDGTVMGVSDSRYDYTTSATGMTNTIFVGGWAYVLDNYGNLITKVEKELYTADPFVEATLNASDISKLGEYYLLYADGRYMIFDADGKHVGYFEPEYDAEYLISMPNGNILMQSVVELNDGVAEYDYYDYDSNKKYDVVTKLFDVASCKTAEIDFPYLITDCYGARNDGNIAVVDCIVIAACTFEDKMLSSELTYLAVGSDGAVKETLPEIIPNQTGLIMYADEDTVLIPATMGNSIFNYRVTDGNFFAYDYDVNSAYSVYGMLVVNDEDDDGVRVYDLIDHSGKVIVDNFDSVLYVVKNEDGKDVSIVVESYIEGDDDSKGYHSVDLCYYNAESDNVVKKNLFSGNVGECSYDVKYYYNARVIRLTVTDYEAEENQHAVKFINATGETVYSLNADSVGADYGNSITYRNDYYDDGVFKHRGTTTVETDDDKIVIKYSRTNSDDDYISYTIIK